MLTSKRLRIKRDKNDGNLLGRMIPIAPELEISDGCLAIFNRWNIKMVEDDNIQLGEGAHGRIYKAETIRFPKRTYALKVIPFHPNPQRAQEDERLFNQEVEFTNEMSNAGIGPILFESWICDEVKTRTQDEADFFNPPVIRKAGFMLMELLEQTAWDYLEDSIEDRDIVEKQLLQLISPLIREMLENGFYPTDMAWDNIMLVKKGNPQAGVRIIDFGTINIVQRVTKEWIDAKLEFLLGFIAGTLEENDDIKDLE